MTRVWPLQEAKNKLSEVVDEALRQGPQIISRRGIETVIVVAYDDYRKLLLSQQRLSLFFQQSPLAGIDLDLERDRSDLRDDPSL